MTDLHSVTGRALHPRFELYRNSVLLIGAFATFLFLLSLARAPTEPPPPPSALDADACSIATPTGPCLEVLPSYVAGLRLSPAEYADWRVSEQDWPPLVPESPSLPFDRRPLPADRIHFESIQAHLQWEAQNAPDPSQVEALDAVLMAQLPEGRNVTASQQEAARESVRQRQAWWDTVRREELRRRGAVFRPIWTEHEAWVEGYDAEMRAHAAVSQVGALLAVSARVLWLLVGLLGLLALRTRPLMIRLTPHMLHIGRRSIPLADITMVQWVPHPRVLLESGEDFTLPEHTVTGFEPLDAAMATALPSSRDSEERVESRAALAALKADSA